MPRRAATVTQADIARAIRALRDAGAPVDRVRVRLDGSSFLVEKLDADDLPPWWAEFGTTPPEMRGIVYVIGFGAWIKIGFTQADTAKRIRELQTGAPEPLVVLGQVEGTTATERDLHRRFASYRAQGEWFRREGELAAWIEAGCPL